MTRKEASQRVQAFRAKNQIDFILEDIFRMIGASSDVGMTELDYAVHQNQIKEVALQLEAREFGVKKKSKEIGDYRNQQTEHYLRISWA